MKNAKYFIDKNGSLILACVSALGVVATAIISSKAAISSYKKIEEKKKKCSEDEPLSKSEIIKTSIEDYIPVILIASGSIWCISATFIFNKKMQSSLSTAYMLVSNSYNEYKKKVSELYGEDVEETIESSIAEDHYRKYMEETDTDEEELFYDTYSERFFYSTMDTVLFEEERLNKKLKIMGYADLCEFYAFLGMDPTDEFDILGWTFDRVLSESGVEKVLFTHTKMRTGDGTEFWKIDTPMCNPSFIIDL